MFQVQRRMCATCIYRPGQHWNIAELEDQVRDKYVGFRSYRVCHHSRNACCHGFWIRHRDKFQDGQVAQRLGLVRFVDVDVLK